MLHIPELQDAHIETFLASNLKKREYAPCLLYWILSNDCRSSPNAFWQSIVGARMRSAHLVNPNASLRSENKIRQLLIDQEISALNRAASVMRSRRNAFSLLSFLPKEILENIFFFCTLGWSDSFAPSDTELIVSDTTWLAVTAVCRVWREIAVKCPRLWWDIPFNLDSDLAILFFTRAKSTPISLSLFGYLTESAASLVRLHLWHIESLMALGATESIKEIIDMLPNGAPMLKRLELKSPGQQSLYYNPQLTLTIDFTRLLVVASQLQELKLIGVGFVCTVGRWSNLRSLSLRGLGPHVDLKLPDFHAFLRCLASARRLELLSLRNFLPVIPSSSDVEIKPVVLNCLEFLHLAGDTEEVITFWKCLEIPPDARIDIAMWRPDVLFDVSRIAKLIGRHFKSAYSQSAKLMRTLVLEDTGSGQMLKARKESTHQDHCLCEIDMILDFYDTRFFSLAHMIHLCNDFDLSKLGVFQFTQYGDESDSETWMDFLRGSKELHFLKLSNQASLQVCEALASKPKKRTSSRNWIFLPSLRDLQIIKVDFDEKYEDSDAYEKFVDWMRSRMQFAPIASLTFSECSADKKDQLMDKLTNIEGLSVAWESNVEDKLVVQSDSEI
jgi:hypothetical protein